jgi:hypothetical protein
MLLSLGSLGQALITPLGDSEMGQVKSILATLNDGSQVEGVKLSSWMCANGMLSSFTMKNADGEKIKFKAAQIKLVQLEPNGFAKAMMFADNLEKNKFLKEDYDFLNNMQYVYYEKVEIKEGKFKLLQLLNPGFDEHIKVYLDPNAQETGMGFGRAEDKSYYIKKGEESFLLKKKKYKKDFPILFGDCKAMMELVETNQLEMNFKELALHIAMYNEFQ